MNNKVALCCFLTVFTITGCTTPREEDLLKVLPECQNLGWIEQNNCLRDKSNKIEESIRQEYPSLLTAYGYTSASRITTYHRYQQLAKDYPSCASKLKSSIDAWSDAKDCANNVDEDVKNKAKEKVAKLERAKYLLTPEGKRELAIKAKIEKDINTICTKVAKDYSHKYNVGKFSGLHLSRKSGVYYVCAAGYNKPTVHGSEYVVREILYNSSNKVYEVM